MKKSLAILILIFALCLSVGAERPATTDSGSAGVRVEISGREHYFETLTPELFLWLSTEVKDDSTVLLLSDLELSSKEGTNFLSLGEAYGDVNAIVLDLNGYTVTYNGPSNLFSIPYDGDLTVKNGTVIYTCEGNTRCPFVLGATSSQQCAPQDAAVALRPRLTLQELQVINHNPETGRVINCFQWMARITVEDCFLWTEGVKTAAIDMRKSTQKSSETVQWKGPYSASVTLKGSTVGTAGSYALAAADACSFLVEETTLVASVAEKDPMTPGTVTGVGEKTTGEWKGKLPDGQERNGVGTSWVVPVAEAPATNITRPPVHNIPEWFSPPSTGVNILVLVIPAAVAAVAAAVLLLTKKK